MTRGPDKQFDRQEVLQRAMAAFWARGYEGTGVTDLIHEMGIGRQSLYNTFGDKRALFLEALALYFQTGMEPILTLLRSPGPAIDNIRKLFQYWEDLACEGHGCMLGNSIAEFGHDDAELTRLLARYTQRLEDALHETLERARQEGSLKGDLSSRNLAKMLVVFSQGGALMSKIRRRREDVREVLGTVWQLLARA